MSMISDIAVAPRVAAGIPYANAIRQRLAHAILTPIRAMRLRHLPFLMVYFAYGALGFGALGLITVANDFFVSKRLALSAADLEWLGVWLTLPWAAKMVFGELVDSVPLLGSQRRSYVFLGAGLVASGLVGLAAAAGGWSTLVGVDGLYLISALLIVVGLVLQDVVADAMTTEVVARSDGDGAARPADAVTRELGMAQVLGRLAVLLGSVATIGLGGWLASIVSYQTVLLLGLIMPAISVTGVLLAKPESARPKPIDWRVLGGGIALGTLAIALGSSRLPAGQEILFLLSMGIVVAMLIRLARGLEHGVSRSIVFATLVVFAFRATPGTGEGYKWFQMKVLGFDEAFFGTLGQIGAIVGILGLWFASNAMTRQPIVRVLLWLTVITTLLSLPNLGLVYGLQLWTEKVFGIGARSIAVIDTTLESPFAQLSMVPVLTLIAIHAPAARRATWFALMASLMNLALIAGKLQTKYLNLLFPVTREDFAWLGPLMLTAVAVGLLLPVGVILALRGRLR
jgi:hypothetical protein